MVAYLKKILVALVASLAFVGTANALLPLGAAVVWLGGLASSNAGAAFAVEATLYVHAGAIAALYLSLADKVSDGQPASPVMQVMLNNTAPRSNPDPTKWDDAASGSRNPTPKSSVSPTSTPVSSGPYPTAAGSWVSYTANWSGCGGSQTTRSFPDIGSLASALVVASNSTLDCNSTASFVYRAEVLSVNQSTSQFTLRLTCEPRLGACPSSGFNNTFTASSANPDPNYVPDQVSSCPPGYTLSGSSCALADASKVQKPADHPCEILRTSSGLQLDAANPNCSGIQVQGNTVQVDQQAISFNADNSVSVSNPNGYTTFQLGADNADGSVQIVGATRSGNPGSYTGGSTSGGSAGGGSTGGSTGTIQCGGVGQPACAGAGDGGGGSCGGPGQAKCGIDDSGFANLGDFSAAGKSGFDQASADRQSAMESQTNRANTLGIETSWLPKPSFNAACEPFVLNFKIFHIQWNWCSYFPLLREVMAYMFYIFTVLYLWQSFMRSTPSAECDHAT